TASSSGLVSWRRTRRRKSCPHRRQTSGFPHHPVQIPHIVRKLNYSNLRCASRDDVRLVGTLTIARHASCWDEDAAHPTETWEAINAWHPVDSRRRHSPSGLLLLRPGGRRALEALVHAAADARSPSAREHRLRHRADERAAQRAAALARHDT